MEAKGRLKVAKVRLCKQKGSIVKTSKNYCVFEVLRGLGLILELLGGTFEPKSMEGGGLELRSAPDKSMLCQGGRWRLDGAGGPPARRGGGDNLGKIQVPNPSRTHPGTIQREEEIEGKQTWESRRESPPDTPLPC